MGHAAFACKNVIIFSEINDYTFMNECTLSLNFIVLYTYTRCNRMFFESYYILNPIYSF